MATMQLPAWYRAWETPGGWWLHPRYAEALRVFEHHTPEKRRVAESIVQYGAAAFPTRPRHVIDFGTGMAAAPLALMREGWTVTLTDVDASKVERLRARLAPPHRAVQVDLLNPGDAFAAEPPASLVCMTHFLYHIPRDDWPQCFDLAMSLCGAEGQTVIVMRSPNEYVNRWCAALGAPIIDVERDATAWAATAGMRVRAIPLPMSLDGLTRLQARLLIEIMLRAVIDPEVVAHIPEEEEIERRIDTELFQGDRCVWPYENTMVILHR